MMRVISSCRQTSTMLWGFHKRSKGEQLVGGCTSTCPVRLLLQVSRECGADTDRERQRRTQLLRSLRPL